MELLTQWCRNCGGDLLKVDDSLYRCRHCNSEYSHEESQKYVDKMRSLFDESKLEAISNARRNLYDAVNAEYISSTRVHECCMILKQYLPDDFQANFYEIAIGSDGRQIARFIRKIDVAENADYMEGAIRFLIRSLQSEYVGQTQELIERTFKNTSLTKYETYSTELSDEAKKLDDCIYMTTYPRDVFVAYSSKDMDEVWELVECLEEQGMSCFVAARNLRHGKGAVENYEQALREAMDNCASFVLVSTPNSRHAGCDALKKEIPYIKQKDMETAPPEHRNDYAGLPHRYKKHRVEYRLRESARPVAADKIVAEFFDGYERVYSPGEVAERVLDANAAAMPAEAVPEKREPKQEIQLKPETETSQEREDLAEALARIKAAKTLDVVTFGAYFQRNLDIKESIEWLVLKKECGLALLLSKYVLLPHEYSDFHYTMTTMLPSGMDAHIRYNNQMNEKYGCQYPLAHWWELSSLRSYLNDVFLNVAFTKLEQDVIFDKTKNTPYLCEHTMIGGQPWGETVEETHEKIFIPNKEELKILFQFSHRYLLSALPTEYAKHDRVMVKKGKSSWWLREHRIIDFRGKEIDFPLQEKREVVAAVGVRPAIWVKYE